MTTIKTAIEIAAALIAKGHTHYGLTAKAWVGPTESRIYFGSEYVRIVNGEITNAKPGKARAVTIGQSAVDAVESVA